MEKEEELNTEDEDYVPETTSKESSWQGVVPTCDGEVCKVDKALGISGRRQRWNNSQKDMTNHAPHVI